MMHIHRTDMRIKTTTDATRSQISPDCIPSRPIPGRILVIAFFVVKLSTRFAVRVKSIALLHRRRRIEVIVAQHPATSAALLVGARLIEVGPSPASAAIGVASFQLRRQSGQNLEIKDSGLRTDGLLEVKTVLRILATKLLDVHTNVPGHRARTHVRNVRLAYHFDSRMSMD